MTNDPTNPHDRLFKQVFSQGEAAFALLRPVFPREVVEAIDSSSLHLEPGSFVDEELRELHRDLLFSAKLRERDVLLYVLLEHQSTVDPLMPLRMLRYVVRVWEAWLREHPDARTIPVVLPIVVHQGPRPWTGPTRLAQLFDLPSELVPALESYLPELELALHDLGALSPDVVRALEAPPVVRLALLLMQCVSRNGDVAAVLAQSAELTRSLSSAPRGYENALIFLRYTLFGVQKDKVMVERIKRELFPELPEGMPVPGSFAEQWISEGIEKGLKQGTQRALERLLRARFGKLDGETKETLEKATTEDLELWCDRVLTAKRVQDVFTPPAKKKRRPKR